VQFHLSIAYRLKQSENSHPIIVFELVPVNWPAVINALSRVYLLIYLLTLCGMMPVGARSRDRPN